MTLGEIERNVFICDIRLTGGKRCFPGVWDLAVLEMQKMRNLQYKYKVLMKSSSK